MGHRAFGDDGGWTHGDPAVAADDVGDHRGGDDLDVEFPRIALLRQRADLGDHRIDEPARQPTTDAGHQPHGGSRGTSTSGDRRRTDRHDRTLRIRGQRLDQHDIGRTGTRPRQPPNRPARSRRRTARVDARTTWRCGRRPSSAHGRRPGGSAPRRSRRERRSSRPWRRRAARRRVRHPCGRCGSRRPTPTRPRTARPRWSRWRTTTTAARRTDDARRCGDTPRRGRTDRRAATRARVRSPRPATPDRHLGHEPRSGGARSDARVDGSSIPQSMTIGPTCRAVPDPTRTSGSSAVGVATIASRGRHRLPAHCADRQAAPHRPQPDTAGRRGGRSGAPADGLADHVPSGIGHPRSVHQREQLDPADRDADPRTVPRLGRPHQPDRHVRPGRCASVPRAAHRELPRVLRCRPLASSRRSVSSELPAFVVHPCRRRRRGVRARVGTRTNGARSPMPSRRPRGGRRSRCPARTTRARSAVRRRLVERGG